MTFCQCPSKREKRARQNVSEREGRQKCGGVGEEKTTKLLLTFRSAFACVKRKSWARMLSQTVEECLQGVGGRQGEARGGAKCWVRRFECRCQVLLFNVVGACQMQQNCTRQTICQSALALDLQHTQTVCERETEREGERMTGIYYSYNLINTQTTQAN